MAQVIESKSDILRAELSAAVADKNGWSAADNWYRVSTRHNHRCCQGFHRILRWLQVGDTPDVVDQFSSYLVHTNTGFDPHRCAVVPQTCALLRQLASPGGPLDRHVAYPETLAKLAKPTEVVWPPVLTVSFNRLGAGASVSEHHGSGGRLRAHIGLDVPKGASMVVAGQELYWREGKSIVFDDSFAHSVHNTGTKPRYILLISFVHPDLQD